MDYVRRIDQAALQAAGLDERFSQSLLDHTSGATSCSVNFIKTPAGGGSPAGLHTHVVDQIFYILSGTMSIEVQGTEYDAPPGSLVFFPKGVPHRNWNAGAEPTLHLAFNAPLPDPAVPFAVSV
jgi:mannose-6-phosphate isomerase-like protein (cupin superfamily)